MFVLTPQPIQAGPGQRVPVRFQLDVPAGLGAGKRACCSVTTTHLETGRRFETHALLTGHQRRAPQRR